MLATLPYVDSSKIGVTGHSSGGTACNMAVAIDNEREKPLISCVLQQAGDWQDDIGADHSGDYGSRSVGIIASTHDDFYFGTYDDKGNMLTTPGEFLNTDGAKKFLNFNEEAPASFTATPDKIYEKNIDGKTAYRAIFRPNCIHPAVTFNSRCATYAIDFFDTTLGPKVSIDSTNLIWRWKAAFNLLGLIGFFFFVISFTLAMAKTEYFKVLMANEPVKPAQVTDSKQKIWFWATSVLSIAFSYFSFWWCIKHVYSNTTEFFGQTGPLTIGTWAGLCGIFAIILMVISQLVFGKKTGSGLKDKGVTMSLIKIWKTLQLALLVVCSSILIVFFADFFFKTDFRFWMFGIKVFTADKVYITLRYLPMFLVFYVAHSVSMNSFNFNTIGGKGNGCMLAAFNALAPVIVVALQYICFYATGRQFFGLDEGSRMGPIWMVNISFILFGSAIFSRIVYKKTHNPYIAGLINAILVTLISCTNTFTTLSAGSATCTTF